MVKDAAGNVSDSLVMGIPDIKTAGTPGNLVHGSDHGGNKSQATIPGQNGEGSLSNLKQVEGSKAGGKEGEKTTGLLAPEAREVWGETDFFVWKYEDS